MIQLSSKPLPAAALTHLATVQQRIDKEPDFAAKMAKADVEWNNKTGSILKAEAFKHIRSTLKIMCVSTEICNYCENSEATHVEHIFPKSLFPERTFQWDNYLLSCGTCNSDHKRDQFAVFDSPNSDAHTHVPRRTQPANSDSVFINPRVDNPLDFFWLDIPARTFFLTPRFDLSLRDERRATYTLDVLKLNERPAVVEARKKAFNYYFDRLGRYVSIKRCVSIAELIIAVPEPHLVDQSLLFEQAQDRILTALKEDILTYAHPTVWFELLRQRTHLPKTDSYLTQAPEALTWHLPTTE
jgi:uncharacterized protein (TIGR02646 family)